jgi:hypothetical protein
VALVARVNWTAFRAGAGIAAKALLKEAKTWALVADRETA